MQLRRDNGTPSGSPNGMVASLFVGGTDCPICGKACGGFMVDRPREKGIPYCRDPKHRGLLSISSIDVSRPEMKAWGAHMHNPKGYCHCRIPHADGSNALVANEAVQEKLKRLAESLPDSGTEPSEPLHRGGNGNGYSPGLPKVTHRFKVGDKVVFWHTKAGQEDTGTIVGLTPAGYIVDFPTANKPIPVPEKEALRLAGAPAEGATPQVEFKTHDGRPVDDSTDIEDIAILDRWPKLHEAALYGVAGDIVGLIDPHTESDRVAILVQTLMAFGNLIGTSAYFQVNATRHFLKIFAVLVGNTAVGRKGTSWDIVRWLMEHVDPIWAKDRITSGLVSGEGLIHHVRDKGTRKPDTKGKPPSTAVEVVDEGVADKRLLVIESEMSRMLKAVNREGNTLSDVIRQAWDQTDLSTMGKQSPAKSTGAHISIMCHSTKDDVIKHLTAVDASNGFANRFLWPGVRRSKLLPDGGMLDVRDLSDVIQRLRIAHGHSELLTQGPSGGRMDRDDAAREIWHGMYEKLSSGKPGMVGKILSRAEAQVMRLACIYALLDRSDRVRAPHLVAAVALWDYCEASARYIFGDSKGDPDADRLVKVLAEAPEGLTRSEISINVFCRHKKAAEIAALLARLSEEGVIHSRKDSANGGRPAERWHWGRIAN